MTHLLQHSRLSGELGVESRDSFSFQLSSVVITGGKDRFRINAGQESREELTEKFFALGQLLSAKKAEQSAWSDRASISIHLADAISLMNREIEGFRGLKLDTSGGDYRALFSIIHDGLRRFRGNNLFCNRIASCLDFAVTINRPLGYPMVQVIELLDAFLGSGPVGVSPTMSRKLASHFARLVASGDPKTMSAMIASLKRNSLLLPGFEGYAIFKDKLGVFDMLGDDIQEQLTAFLLAGRSTSDLRMLHDSLQPHERGKARQVARFIEGRSSATKLVDDGLLASDITGPIPSTER